MDPARRSISIPVTPHCLICTVFLAALSGCTSDVIVRPDEPLNNDRVFNYQQVNERVAGRRVEVRCVNGSAFAADNLTVGPDSISFVDAASGNCMRIATTAVKNVRRTVYDGPAVVHASVAGAGLGFVFGMTVGGIITAHAEAEERIGLGVLVLGSIGAGAIIGGVIGANNGREETFEFRPPR